jgi:hypothetical protein
MHRDVGNNDIRMKAMGQFYRLIAIVRFTANLVLQGGFQNVPHSSPDKGMVVGKEYTEMRGRYRYHE